MSHYTDTDLGRRRLQEALKRGGFYTGEVDGDLGPKSKTAIRAARAAFGMGSELIIDDALLERLGLRAPSTPKLNLLSLIGIALTLAKGKTMTKDQIEGIIRAVVTAVVGYLAGKNIIPEGSGGDLIAAVTTLGAIAWSIHSNRAGKVLTPMGK